MKVLIVGGLGKASTAISRKLSEKFELTVYELEDKPADFPCQVVLGNIIEDESLAEKLAGHDAVISFAVGGLDLTVTGMINLFMAAEKAGIPHMVLTSSGGGAYPIPVYRGMDMFDAARFSQDFWDNYLPAKDDFGIFPGLENNTYHRNKWLLERIAKRMGGRPVKVTVIRPGNIMTDDMNLGKPNRVNDPMYLLMCGHATITNCAQIYELCVKNPPESFAVYNLGNDTEYCNITMKKAITELGFQSINRQVYLDFYAEQDWQMAYKTLIEKGFPNSMLAKLYAFRDIAAAH